ncbi:MAG: aldo/keto reductase [Clostridia bacterium]|nr:aldo/keto reductase [Clostridia bacterium]
MITREFQNGSLPMLGLGCMRLPLIEGGKNGDIDKEKTAEMVRMALEGGIRYFDTAYPYHEGNSETVMGEILSRYPRESYLLASKYPGHQIAPSYHPAEVFEDQLKKCRVEYFDFYLLHNVFEKSIETYMDPQWDIVNYFIRQKKEGRIRHLGFSSHGKPDVIRAFLDRWGDELDFCMIQLNWLDWSLQNAAEKVHLLQERKIPIWVMEPLRGGKLIQLTEKQQDLLRKADPTRKSAEWSFRFLQGIPGVTVVLSGMSSPEQMAENLKYFEKEAPLSEKEQALLFEVAEQMKHSVPCTSCGYCLKGCPKGLDIPFFLSVYNELQVSKSFNVSMRIELMEEDKKPSACIDCGACMSICPQKIKIPEKLRDLSEILKTMPSWRAISRERTKLAETQRNGRK